MFAGLQRAQRHCNPVSSHARAASPDPMIRNLFLIRRRSFRTSCLDRSSTDNISVHLSRACRRSIFFLDYIDGIQIEFRCAFYFFASPCTILLSFARTPALPMHTLHTLHTAVTRRRRRRRHRPPPPTPTYSPPLFLDAVAVARRLLLFRRRPPTAERPTEGPNDHRLLRRCLRASSARSGTATLFPRTRAPPRPIR